MEGMYIPKIIQILGPFIEVILFIAILWIIFDKNEKGKLFTLITKYKYLWIFVIWMMFNAVGYFFCVFSILIVSMIYANNIVGYENKSIILSGQNNSSCKFNYGQCFLLFLINFANLLVYLVFISFIGILPEDYSLDSFIFVQACNIRIFYIMVLGIVASFPIIWLFYFILHRAIKDLIALLDVPSDNMLNVVEEYVDAFKKEAVWGVYLANVTYVLVGSLFVYMIVHSIISYIVCFIFFILLFAFCIYCLQKIIKSK